MFLVRPTSLAIREFVFNAAEHDSENIELPKDIWRDAIRYIICWFRLFE